ncbi:hypothetical protein [Spirosoma utsteinense]|uniref:Lipocalin-like domain-containing protein n=1 Tax=Spirosoma utsteinense TaxID=2585773 RepID=A0ABR6WF07_9BACT|nr:hypothetical protein [Spirosoma utsteinense]MBC3785684.1 hypothetical protein [Spirosoma utsteinense]MBC3795135.1 hypothetical protein [Spirosoma utsteinense]
MRNILSFSNLIAVMSILSVLIVSCNQNEVATQKAIADKKAVGRWNLVGITSGWTGKTNPPIDNVELAIDQQQKAVIYENGKEMLTFQYSLEETKSGLVRYSITQKAGNSPIFYPPSRGNFRVNTKQLIIGDTGADGNDYTFTRD